MKVQVFLLKFQMEILSQFERFSHPIFIFYRLAKPTVLAENGEASHEDGKKYKLQYLGWFHSIFLTFVGGKFSSQLKSRSNEKNYKKSSPFLCAK